MSILIAVAIFALTAARYFDEFGHMSVRELVFWLFVIVIFSSSLSLAVNNPQINFNAYVEDGIALGATATVTLFTFRGRLKP